VGIWFSSKALIFPLFFSFRCISCYLEARDH